MAGLELDDVRHRVDRPITSGHDICLRVQTVVRQMCRDLSNGHRPSAAHCHFRINLVLSSPTSVPTTCKIDIDVKICCAIEVDAAASRKFFASRWLLPPTSEENKDQPQLCGR